MKNSRLPDKSGFANLLHASVLLLAMGLLFGLLGWMVFGVPGVFMSLVLSLLVLMSTPRITPAIILKMYGARELSRPEAPGLYSVTDVLARRAGLTEAPHLYYVPSTVMNAFSVGTRESSAIALSDRLVRYLSSRELTGVIAHEMSHIRNNDLRLHTFADMMTRITSLLSFVGQVLVIVYLPMVFFTSARVPFVLILVLVFAPTLSVLLQLALSRNREYAADTTAVTLTGDPEGLASALKKMDTYEQKLWDILILPGRKVPGPSMLRTHPHTEERVRRIMLLAGDARRRPPGPDSVIILPDHFPPVAHAPRWNPFQPWH